MCDSPVNFLSFVFVFFGGVSWALKEKRGTELAQSEKYVCARECIWHFWIGLHFVCMWRYFMGGSGFSYRGVSSLSILFLTDIPGCTLVT